MKSWNELLIENFSADVKKIVKKIIAGSDVLGKKDKAALKAYLKTGASSPEAISAIGTVIMNDEDLMDDEISLHRMSIEPFLSDKELKVLDQSNLTEMTCIEEALGQKDVMNQIQKAWKAVDQIEWVAKKAGIGLSESGIGKLVDEALKKLDAVKDKVSRLMEMTDHRRAAENAKAQKRINDFWDRSKGDQAKFTKQINLRTKKMTKVDKVKIWADALEDQNFHAEAEVAFKRLKELGVK
jgi:hypothetical protein